MMIVDKTVQVLLRKGCVVLRIKGKNVDGDDTAASMALLRRHL